MIKSEWIVSNSHPSVLILLSISSIQFYFELLNMGNMSYTYLYHAKLQAVLGKVMLNDKIVLIKTQVFLRPI